MIERDILQYNAITSKKITMRVNQIIQKRRQQKNDNEFSLSFFLFRAISKLNGMFF